MFNPLSVFNPSRLFSIGLAFATGGMSLYMQLAREFITMAGAELIQRLGTRLGLPQPLIDAATSAFTGQFSNPITAARSLDDAARAFQQVGATPQQVGDMLRDADSTINNMINQMLPQIGDGDADYRSAAGKGFLIRLAIALGKALDTRLNRMAALGDQIGGLGKITDDKQSKLGELNAELQGQAQYANMLSNALKNALEAVGSAGTTLARRG